MVNPCHGCRSCSARDSIFEQECASPRQHRRRLRRTWHSSVEIGSYPLSAKSTHSPPASPPHYTPSPTINRNASHLRNTIAEVLGPMPHYQRSLHRHASHNRNGYTDGGRKEGKHSGILIHSPNERPASIAIPSAYHSMLAGAGAGLVSSVVTCPLDVVKTRLQAQVKQKGAQGYEGARETCIKIWRSGGVRGLYRGLGPTVLGYLPTWGIYFSVYDEVKSVLINRASTDKNHWGIHIVAAMVAGASGTIVTNPLWLIRTRFMNQATSSDGQERYTSTWRAFRSIYNTEGWRAFYKGLAPSLIGVTHVAVHFPLYEKMKLWAAPEDGSPLNSQRILLCSAGSKMVASVITYPHEVLRTRLQIQKRKSLVAGSNSTNTNSAITTSQDGLIATARSILKQDGWRGFYRGISINLVRTVPSSAVTMLTYELIMRRLTAESSR